MSQKQKLKELHDKLNKWKEEQGIDDEEFEGILIELSSLFDPAGDDPSNPPGSGPGTPP